MTLQNIEQYGPHFQTKVLSSLLTHKKFLVNIYDVLNDVKEKSSLSTSGLSRQAIDAKTLLGEALKTMPSYGQMLLKYGKRKSLVNQGRLPQ